MSCPASTYHSPKTLRSLSDLVDARLLTAEQVPDLQKVADLYQIAIPPTLAALIDGGNPHDPIGRQFVPSVDELQTTADELQDPIGDQAKSPVPGLVHRYPDRVLLKPLLVCPVYCRFCFRRASVGDADATMSTAQIRSALDYIAAHPQVREVILTGGDPLMLTVDALDRLTGQLTAIPHLDIIRWHSRVPIAAPQRITPQVAEVLAQPFGQGKAAWLSIHVNHPAELTAAAVQAITHLRQAGIPLVAQTVLLNGINDRVEILETLFRALIRAGVKPYYLHHPDLAPGTGHFRLPVERGRALVNQLRGRLTGTAIPTYVLDIPGGAGKSPLTADYWNPQSTCITDWQGQGHRYGD